MLKTESMKSQSFRMKEFCTTYKQIYRKWKESSIEKENKERWRIPGSKNRKYVFSNGPLPNVVELFYVLQSQAWKVSKWAGILVPQGLGGGKGRKSDMNAHVFTFTP